MAGADREARDDLHDLIAYTTWQRGLWRSWLAARRQSALRVATGPNGDGRFPTVGSLIRHIFSAELRYLQRIAGSPLTDATLVPTDDVAALFEFGAAGRARLAQLVKTMPPALWDAPIELPLSIVRPTPRKIILHVLTHEIRHWAQVVTLLRLQGWRCDVHDLLASPVRGDPVLL